MVVRPVELGVAERLAAVRVVPAAVLLVEPEPRLVEPAVPAHRLLRVDRALWAGPRPEWWTPLPGRFPAELVTARRSRMRQRT